MKSYDFFTQYDSSSYSTYKSTVLKLSKINNLRDLHFIPIPFDTKYKISHKLLIVQKFSNFYM